MEANFATSKMTEILKYKNYVQNKRRTFRRLFKMGYKKGKRNTLSYTNEIV